MAAAPKAPHPVEERDRLIIAGAVEFTATVRYARQNWTCRCPSLREAADAALKLEEAMRRAPFPKLALVYAVNARGRSALVPRAQWLGAGPVPADYRDAKDEPAPLTEGELAQRMAATPRPGADTYPPPRARGRKA